MAGHPGCDGRVVGRRPFKGAGRQPPTLGQRCAAAAEGGEEFVVLFGAGHHRGERVVFGRGPHEAGTAHVDQFDRLASRAIGPGNSRLEGVEVDNHSVERVDAVVGEDSPVIGTVVAGEHAREDPRVERLHAAVEDLGEGRDGRDVLDFEAVADERCARAAGAHHADTRRFQAGSQSAEAGLVEHAHEHAADGDNVNGGRAGRRGSMGWIHRRD